jgi:arabinose-5-phosphate isomerase
MEKLMGEKEIGKRVREILEAEAKAILDVPVDGQFPRAVATIARCTGKIITTGMGKAGHIAQKIAGTLCSTGTPACYLHPGDAAHGDLGLVCPNDIVLAFSTSGQTREVIELLQLVRRIGILCVISVTSHPDSQVRLLSDIVLGMGEIEEPWSLGLTPTASTAAMLAIGDALALLVMEARGFSREDYGLRHHGGYLGKKSRISEA